MTVLEENARTEVLFCLGCREPWQRAVQSGRKPILCTTCRETTRWCRECSTAKPLSEFHQRSSARSGMTGSCSSCRGVTDRCWTCGGPSQRVDRGRGYSHLRYCSPACRPRCSFDPCDEPMKYRTDVGELCPVHYVRWRVHGDPAVVLVAKDLSEPPDTCRQCGGPRGAGYAKWFCSVRCCGRARRSIDERRTRPCAACERPVSVQDSRTDARLCKGCRSVRPPLSARQLAERDGPDCGICGVVVDLQLDGHRDLYGPAVDHVVPRAAGGPNTPENLQLSHHRCNATKQDRLEVAPALAADLAAAAQQQAGASRPLPDTCGRGHARTAQNGRWEPSGWRCIPCRTQTQRDRRARRRREALSHPG